MQLDIEIDEERLEKSLHSAYRKVANKARIPGFRPGKAPRNVVERLYGREGLIREALDDLVPAVYNDAIKEHDVDAIGQPDLEIVEFDPVRFKAIVPVRPTVALGAYRNIRAAEPEVTIDQQEVEKQILHLRRHHATLVPVERPVQWNDQIIAKIHAVVDDDDDQIPYVQNDDATVILREGDPFIMEGLPEALIGLTPGEEHTFDVPFPEDFTVERFRGAPVHFTVTVNELKEEHLPELDDEFAVSVNPEWETFDALKENIETQLRARQQNAADNEYRNTALDLLVSGANIEYPQVLVDREIDSIVREAMGTDANTYRTYLQRVGRSEAEFREQFRQAAETRLKRSLALGQLADDEKIEVTPEEIESELQTILGSMTEENERIRTLFDSEVGRETIRRDTMTKKTLARLIEIAKSDEPVTETPLTAEVEGADGPATAEVADQTPAEPEATGTPATEDVADSGDSEKEEPA